MKNSGKLIPGAIVVLIVLLIVNFWIGSIPPVIPRDETLLFDGSLSFKFLEAARKKGTAIVEKLVPGDRVTVIVYDGEPRLLFDRYIQTESDKEAAVSVINGIKRGTLIRGTDFEAAYNYAVSLINERTGKAEQQLIILGDLEHDSAKEITLKKAPEDVQVIAAYMNTDIPKGYDYGKKALEKVPNYSGFSPKASDTALDNVRSQMNDRKVRSDRLALGKMIIQTFIVADSVLLVFLLLSSKKFEFKASGRTSAPFSALHPGRRFPVGPGLNDFIEIKSAQQTVGQFLIRLCQVYYQNLTPKSFFTYKGKKYIGTGLVRLEPEGTVIINGSEVHYSLTPVNNKTVNDRKGEKAA